MSIWEQIDFDAYNREREAANSTAIAMADTGGKPNIRRFSLKGRPLWTVLNIVATLFWLYVIVKLVVGDADRWVVSSYAPGWLWVLDLRFVFGFVLIALIFAFTRRWRTAGILSYVILYPFLCVFWKLPRLYYRAQSWNLIIGTVHVLWSLGRSARFTVIFGALFAVGVTLTFRSGTDAILIACVLLFMFIWTVLLLRAVAYSFTPSQFMVHQRKVFEFVLGSAFASRMVTIPDIVKESDGKRLEKVQVDHLVAQASMGLAVYGSSALWARKLDDYRKSGAFVVSNAFAVLALALQAIVLVSLANYGIYKVDPTQYAFADPPGLLDFLRYGLNSMYAGEIDALGPAGTYAETLSLLTGVSCAIVLLVLVVSVIFSVKQTQDNRVAEQAVEAMRKKADSYAAKLAGEYRVPVGEILDNIAALGGVFANWLEHLAYVAGVVHHRISTDHSPTDAQPFEPLDKPS